MTWAVGPRFDIGKAVKVGEGYGNVAAIDQAILKVCFVRRQLSVAFELDRFSKAISTGRMEE